MLVVESARADGVLTGLLATEIVKDDPGQEAVLDRLLDMLLISTLRAWFAHRRPGARLVRPRTPTRSSAARCR